MKNDGLSKVFIKWSLLDWWDTLLQAYKEMGFTDQLNDGARIEEFTKITELMNTWISKAEKVVTPHWPFNKEEGIEALLNMNQRTAYNSRVNLVYAKLRDNWTENVTTILTNMLINEAQEWAEEEKESDDDGRSHYEF